MIFTVKAKFDITVEDCRRLSIKSKSKAFS